MSAADTLWLAKFYADPADATPKRQAIIHAVHETVAAEKAAEQIGEGYKTATLMRVVGEWPHSIGLLTWLD